jgi:hypothetical protein
MTRLKMSDGDVFDTDEAARDAFLANKLEWSRFAEALIYKTTTVSGERNVTGHETVVVHDVQSIAPDGTPVYTCQKDDTTVVQIEARELFTERELMCKADGSPSDYAVWMARKIQRKHSNAARVQAQQTGGTRLPPVTVLLKTI